MAVISIMCVVSSCQQSGQISGIWFANEGGKDFRDIIGSVPFGGNAVQIIPLTDAAGQVIFGDATDNDKSVGLKFITSKTVTFLVPADNMIYEITSELNYKFENDRFILIFDKKEILSARYELKSDFTLFLDDGKKIVFRKK